MIYRPAYGSNDSERGILSYDVGSRVIEVIASSRKKSAGEGPDGRADWDPSHAFYHGDGIVVAGKLISDSLSVSQLYRRGARQPWISPFTNDGLVGNYFPSPGGDTLVALGGGNSSGSSDAEQIIHFPTDGTSPRTLARVKTFPRRGFGGDSPVLSDTPVWTLPDSFARVDPDRCRKFSALYLDGRLYLSSGDFHFRHKAPPDNAFLHVFDQDGSMKSLPLDLDPRAKGGDAQKLSEHAYKQLIESAPAPGALFAVADGLLIGFDKTSSHSVTSIWKIPFTEINALLAKTPSFSPPTQSAE